VTVVLPAMNQSQTQSWRALLAVQRVLPVGWCLVGGQLVHLHCCERGLAPNRPTNDGDVALDVRGRPAILQEFTAALHDLGFSADGTSWEGHQHRWVNGAASIDVLIPRGVGERAAARSGVSGGTTLESPGAQQAIERTELVEVQVEDDVGFIPRPNLLGALVSKAAAYTFRSEAGRERHLIDFAVLASLIARSDRIAEQMTDRDRRWLPRCSASWPTPAVAGSASPMPSEASQSSVRNSNCTAGDTPGGTLSPRDARRPGDPSAATGGLPAPLPKLLAPAHPVCPEIVAAVDPARPDDRQTPAA